MYRVGRVEFHACFRFLSQKFLKKGASPENALAQAVQVTNDMYAGQNWEVLMARHPSLGREGIRLLRILTFAPDYLTSNINKILRLPEKSLAGAIYRKEAMAGIFLGFIMTQGLNYALNGHSTAQNKDGNEMAIQVPWIKDEKGSPLAVNLLGNWGEPLKVLDNPVKFASGKKGTLIKAIVDISSGYGLKPADYLPIPFALQPLGEYAKGKLTEGKQAQVPSTGLQAGVQSLIDVGGGTTTYRQGKKNTGSLIQSAANLR